LNSSTDRQPLSNKRTRPSFQQLDKITRQQLQQEKQNQQTVIPSDQQQKSKRRIIAHNDARP
jgi:hypothetical protein